MPELHHESKREQKAPATKDGILETAPAPSPSCSKPKPFVGLELGNQPPDAVAEWVTNHIPSFLTHAPTLLTSWLTFELWLLYPASFLSTTRALPITANEHGRRRLTKRGIPWLSQSLMTWRVPTGTRKGSSRRPSNYSATSWKRAQDN